MTPEELGRIAFATCLGPEDADKPWAIWETQPYHVKLTWVKSALAVAAAVKREDAQICDDYALGADYAGHIAKSCADEIRATIPEGK